MSYNNNEKFYCPECGKKKLVVDHQYHGNGYHRVYRCTYNEPPSTWRGRRNWNSEENPPCKLVIKSPLDKNGNGRDAEIEDYGLANPLSALSNARVPQIQQWLLTNDSDVRKKGIEVLYEGTMLDLVRRTDGCGLGVAIYWRSATWDASCAKNPLHRDNDALRAESSGYLDFQGMRLNYLFTGHPVIWQKGEVLQDAVFKGKTLGKKLKAKLISFAKGVEANYDKLLTKAKSEHDRWNAEAKNFREKLDAVWPKYAARYGHRPPVYIDHYCGETATAKVSLAKVTATQAVEIERVLGIKIKVDFSLGDHGREVTPETAVRLSELILQDPGVSRAPKFNVNPFVYGDWRKPTRRVTLDEAVALMVIVFNPSMMEAA